MIQVVDASVVVVGLLDDGELGRWSELRLLEADLAAPALMAFEAANVLRRAEARGRIDASLAVQALADLDRLDWNQVEFGALAERAWELRRNLTIYDASYVAAAELLECRLVTVDRRLAAAPGTACEIVIPPN